MSKIGTMVALAKALGTPNDTQVASAVDDWLTDHPEATTTVQDGAITRAKLDSDMKAAVDDGVCAKTALTNNKNDGTLWEKGGISSSTGANSASNTRIRTKDYVPDAVSAFEISSGYKYIVAAYNGSTYVGMWNGSAFAKSATWLTGTFTIDRSLGYKYKIVLALSNDGTIDTSDYSNLVLCSFTDGSLLLSGMPADSKEVGDAISNVEERINTIATTELRGTDGWTFYSHGRLKNDGTIETASGDSVYIRQAEKDIQIWSDDYIYANGKDFIMQIYNGSTINADNYANMRGRQRKADDEHPGLITGDNMPKENSKWTITAGQYMAVSMNNETVSFKLLADNESGYTKHLHSNVVLDDAQISQVKAALPKGIVEKESNIVHLYIPTSNGKYLLEYQFRKVDDADINAYGWRLCYLWLCNLDKTHVGYIAYTGEWEMAVKIDGRSDFIGLGNHGDEIQTLFKLYIDGKSISENDTFGERPFEEAQLVCKLTMYDPADNTTVVGYHTRIDTVNSRKKTVIIQNKVDFDLSSDLTIHRGYLFMAPIARSNDSVQVSDAYIDDEDYVMTDCSTTTFSPGDAGSGVGKTKHGTTEYKFWGSGYDLHGYAKILKRVAPEGNTQTNFIDDAASYNKVYLSMCDDETVSDGDKWELQTEFFLDCGYDPA